MFVLSLLYVAAGRPEAARAAHGDVSESIAPTSI